MKPINNVLQQLYFLCPRTQKQLSISLAQDDRFKINTAEEKAIDTCAVLLSGIFFSMFVWLVLRDHFRSAENVSDDIITLGDRLLLCLAGQISKQHLSFCAIAVVKQMKR